MEHIVQFAIGIDDEAIRERVIECAYNDVVKKLMEEAKRETHLVSKWGTSYERQHWGDIIDRALHDWFDDKRDEIIDMAASKLANSYLRSKAFKTAMAKKTEEL